MSVWVLTTWVHLPFMGLTIALWLGRLPMPTEISPGIVPWLPFFVLASWLGHGLRGNIRKLAEGETDVGGNVRNALGAVVAGPGTLLGLIVYNSVMLSRDGIGGALFGIALFIILNSAVASAQTWTSDVVGADTPAFFSATWMIALAFQATLKWGALWSRQLSLGLGQLGSDLLAVALFFALLLGGSALLLMVSRAAQKWLGAHPSHQRSARVATIIALLTLVWLCFLRSA